MPKLKGQYLGKLVSYDKEERGSNFSRDVGHVGYVNLYESLSLHPGTHFVQFFYNSDGDDLDFTDRYLITACGDLELTEDQLIIRNTRSSDNTFTFELYGTAEAEPIDLY